MNPIRYTSRTYQSILNDINSDDTLADKPEWFKRLIAGLGDTMSMIIDAQANNSYLETAFTRDAVRKLCALIGYRLSPASTSVGTLKFYLDKDTIFPITISSSDLVGLSGTVTSQRFESRNPITMELDEYALDVSSIIEDDIIKIDKYSTYDKVRITGEVPSGLIDGGEYYITRVENGIKLSTSVNTLKSKNYISINGGGEVTLRLLSFEVTCYQQELKPQISIGESDPNKEWQEFDLPDENILQDTLVISIGSEVWTRVDNFGESGKQSTHYMLEYDSKGNAKIIFGNGEYGKIPENFPILATYAVGGGSNTNVSKTGVISNYAGGNQAIKGVVNSSIFSGGEDAESMASAKILAPAQLKTRDRFVTVEDGLNLIQQYGGISLAKIISNKFGLLSCQVLCVANGGGNPNSQLKNSLQQFLIDRSVLGSLDVRVQDTNFVSQSLEISVNINAEYEFERVKPYIDICCKLFFTECGAEIVSMYIDNGISDTVSLINQIFSTEYKDSDTQIRKMVDYLRAYGTRDYGVTIYEVDLISMIKTCVSGINYITNSEIFPISFNEDEISTIGTYTINEV